MGVWRSTPHSEATGPRAVEEARLRSLRLRYRCAFEAYQALLHAHAEIFESGDEPTPQDLLAERNAWEALDVARDALAMALSSKPAIH